MANYKLTDTTTTILRTTDGAYIPTDEGNTDYQAYLAWVALGNTADPVDPVSVTEQLAINTAAIQTALDTLAQTRGYNSIASACSYANTTAVVPSTDTNFAQCEKFRLEGNALQIQLALTWAAAYAYMATVTAGTNPMPTAAEAVAMIPAFTWPD